MTRAMIDEDRVDQILERILEAIHQDQGSDSFDNILEALQDAIAFQMALTCPACRRKIARKLRADIPAMLTRAAQFAAEAQQEHGEHHYQH
jgi:hypothetical protein